MDPQSRTGYKKKDDFLDLNTLNRNNPNLPWNLTLSYGRALQHDAIIAWAGENRIEAQQKLISRSKNNSLATEGQFK